MTTLLTSVRHPSVRNGEPWWKGAVVYQIYPRSFADGDGDGMGDLRGIIEHADHLVRLGVDVVWLSPVYASPQDDNGYDISDYFAVHPAFGTLDDLDELIATLHERGIRLIMDLVVNHTSDEHAWFQESRSSLDNPKRDWYIWRDPRDGGAPNNWGSFFSGPAWDLDEATGQYYLHLFSPKQPDLNWENHEVRSEIYRMMNWWLDRGVDGFRMDVISFISKPDDLADGRVGSSGWGDGMALYGSGPRIHDYLQEMHREVFDGRADNVLTVGEMVDVTPEKARLYTDPRRRELDMVFHFDHVGLDHGPGGKFTAGMLDLVALKRVFARWQEELADVGWNSLYWNNHDQPRVVSRFGDDTRYWYESATALATTLHLMRGTPYIYQGEEIGMTNMPFASIDDFRDLETLNHYREVTRGMDPDRARHVLEAITLASRDNARTPVQWNGSPGAGFSSAEPWIAVNPNHTWLNAEAQYDDPRSVFAWYRRLIELRHSEPVVVDGRFRLLLAEDPQVFAYTRTLDATTLLVVANLSGRPATLPDDLCDQWRSARTVLGNHREGAPLAPRLAPWETVVAIR
ncbi:glycoside hydrolase family 13 protein [Agromyces silvae]|uniref:glycoside hydrolase family 13 protein n=1 Tax=Agromyces silvae TaxID=3388266 RepID=UPI00280BA311|nr:alpha-glucosidase [Agromyces protaetiae]